VVIVPNSMPPVGRFLRLAGHDAHRRAPNVLLGTRRDRDARVRGGRRDRRPAQQLGYGHKAKAEVPVERDDGGQDRAARVRGELARAVGLGCEDPALVEMWADRLATGGRIEDIREAHAACEALLAARPDPSDSAWTSLAVTRDQLAARLTRMVERKRINKDGVIELMRWRHPGPRSRRVRPMRFVRP